jgi:hypothetical protein
MIEYTDKWSVTDDFWSERSFTFATTECTEYMWPKDRIIAFEDSTGANVLIPTFDLINPRVGEDIEAHIKQAIESAPVGIGKQYKKIHLHLIRVEDHPTIVAMFVDRTKRKPVLDFFAKKE